MKTLERPGEQAHNPVTQPTEVLIEEVRRRRRRRRLRNLGVLLLLGLIAGITIVANNGGGSGGRHSAGGHATQPNPVPGVVSRPPGSAPSSSLLSAYDPVASGVTFKLFAPGIGLVIPGGIYQLQLTQNGGKSWQNISPSLAGKLTGGGGPWYDQNSLDATGPTHFVVGASPGAFAGEFGLPQCGRGNTNPKVENEPYSALEVTNDAGATWKSETLPGCLYASSLSFLDDQHGFAFALNYDQSTKTTVGNLFSTNNRGVTWSKVANTPAMASIDFTSTSLGWGVSGPPVYGPQHATKQPPVVWRTVDGGKTWQSVRLPNLSLERGQFLAPWTSVQFFGSQDGVIPLSIANAKAKIVGVRFDVTTNGGRSWRAASIPAKFNSSLPYYDGLATQRPDGSDGGYFAVPVSVVSDTHWFVGVGTDLYGTTNGGATWFKSSLNHAIFSSDGTRWHRTSAAPGVLDSIDFISANYGWATDPVLNGGGSSGGLLVTTNGGRSWADLAGEGGF